MTASKKYHYRGELAERPLAEILHTVYQHRVPGVLQVVRDDVVKRLYVRDGTVIYASSSDRKESLGAYLLDSGHISRHDYKTTMRERRGSDRRYGVVLVERGLVAPFELQRLIRRQTAQVLWGLFSWIEGEVTFSIGDFPEPSSTLMQIPIRQAIKDGVRRVGSVAPLLARVGSQDTRLEPIYDTDDLIDAGLRQEEYELLKMIDGRRSLLNLCDDGPLERRINARLLYAYYVLQFVRPLRRENSRSIKIRLKTASP